MGSQQNLNLTIQNNCYCQDLEPLEREITQESEKRIDYIVSHMYKQYKEHVSSSENTTIIFNQLLEELHYVTTYLKTTFERRGIDANQIFYEVDADKSVGILKILWHSISFTTRGNTKPQAIPRKDESPLFCGRIIALNGDFHDNNLDLSEQDFPEILHCEVASMFVPANKHYPALVKVKHIGDREFPISQPEAARNFLLKVIEIICGGGIFHEVAPDLEYDAY